MKKATNEDDRPTPIPTITNDNSPVLAEGVICRHGYLVVGSISCPICDRIGGE